MPTRVIHKTLDECVAPRQTMEHGLFLTRKIIGSQQLSACDPFILADHVGPIQYGAGEALGVPDHPHRGLVVVTYVVEGGMRHQDSLGHNDELLAGSVQWLTTGRGLVHRELPNDQLLADGGTWEGFQLWINLPKKDKMVCPEMQEVRPEDVPQFCDQLGRFSVKVLIGKYKDVRSPIRTHTPVTLLDVRVTAASSFSLELPDGHTCWLYVWRGAGTLGHGEQRPVRAGHVARLSDDGHAFQATAGREDDMRLLIGSGVPLKESIFKFGTFVMSSVSEIEQALEDYRSGRLGRITVGASRDGGGSAAARGLDLMNPFQGEIERIGAEPEAVAEEGGAAAPSAADSEPTAARLTNGHRHF